MINHTITVLNILVQEIPVGTNLGLLHFLWMLVSGALLPNRGAIHPALQSIGLEDDAVRRAWTAFRKGMWQISSILILWNQYVKSLPAWQEHRYEDYRPVAADVTAFWRPALPVDSPWLVKTVQVSIIIPQRDEPCQRSFLE